MSEDTNLERSFMDVDVVVDLSDPSISHDRVLVVEGRKFYVTSGLLSLSSEFFNGLFNASFKEKDQAEIVLKEVKSDEFEHFLRAIYPMEYEVNESNLAGLMKLSGQFLCKIVWKKCMKYLDPKIIFEKFKSYDLLEWSVSCNSNDFKVRVEKDMIAKFANLGEREKYKNAKAAFEYDLKEMQKIVMEYMENLFKSGEKEILTKKKFVLYSSLSYEFNVEKVKNEIRDFVAYCFAKFCETNTFMFLEKTGIYLEYCKGNIPIMLVEKFLKDRCVREVKEVPSLLRLATKYDLPYLKKVIIRDLSNDFVASNYDFKFVPLAVEFNLEPFNKTIQAYLKKNWDTLSNAQKDIIFDTSPEVTRFALEAIVGKRESSPDENIPDQD